MAPSPLVDATTSRRYGVSRRVVVTSPLLLSLPAVSVPLLVTGCSGAGSTSRSSSAALPSSTSSAAGPRVVTLDPFSTQDAYDLGVQPVAGQDGLEQVVNSTYAEQYRSLARTGTFDEPNLEAVAAADPDLILAASAQQALADELNAIAPTTFVSATSSATWKQAAQEVAAALGRQDELTVLRQDYEQRAAAVRDEYADVLGRTRWALVWLPRDDGIGLRATTSNCGQVFTDAGIQFIDAASTAADGKDTRLGWELLDPLRTADVIGLPADSDGAPDVDATAITENAAFAGLPVARAGRLPTFPHFTPSSYRNAIELISELDSVLKSMSA